MDDKKLELVGDTIEVVDNLPLNTIFHLNTGKDVQFSGSTITSANTNSYRSTLIGVEIGRRLNTIGYRAFYGCTGLTSIIIPRCVTSIKGEGAFNGCTSLSSVTISDSVTSIDNYAFSGCTTLPVDDYGLRYADSYLVEATDRTKTTVEIKQGTKWIGSSVFSNCSGLTSVTIPNSVTSIGSQAFYGCSCLTSVTIGNSVTSIEYGAFINCTSLASVVIPDNVTKIGGYAFSGCTQLSAVTLSRRITSIPVQVFYGCTSLPVIDSIRYADWYLVGVVDKSLSSYTIKQDTRYIDEHAFDGCSGVTCIEIPSGVFGIGNPGNGAFSGVPFVCYAGTATGAPWGAGHAGVLIENEILYGNFEKTIIVANLNRNASSIEIANGVESIGADSFAGMSSLKSVSIPNSVESIGSRTFSGCTSLSSVTIGSGVTYIGENAFRGCSSLTEINIPADVKIGDMAFFGCTSLPVINDIIYADTYDVDVVDGSKSTYILKSGTTWIGSHAFYDCPNLTGITLPETIIGIGSNAFYGDGKLMSINIPSGVKYFGTGILRNCTGFTDVQNNIRYADTYLIGVADKNNYVGAIRNGTRVIGAFAFYNNTRLYNAPVIPNTVEYIDEYAFYYPSFPSVSIPDSVKIIGKNAFRGTPQGMGLYSVTFGSGLTEIGNSAFSYSRLGTVNLPDSVVTIASGAFDGAHVSSLHLGSGIRNIGHWAFMNCKIKNLVIPDTADNINSQAFYGNDMVYMVYNGPCTGAPFGAFNCTVCKVIDGGVAYIDKEKTEIAKCFDTSISEVTIPNTVKIIRSNAFSGCTKIHIIDVPNTIKSIGSKAFYSVPLVCYGGSLSGAPWGAKHYGVLKEDDFVYADSEKTNIVAYINKSATEITIPPSVSAITEGAFSGCTGITSIVIPSSIRTIPNNAFSGCTSLTSVTIPNIVTSIGSHVFSKCGSLTSVTIPNSVTIIGPSAFSGCGGLAKVNITDIAAWCNIAFSNNYSNPLYYAKHLYMNDVEVTNLDIPECVTSIGDNAFYGCSGLTSITMPNSITSIGRYAFSSCFGLAEISIPNSVTSLGYCAFFNCSGLTSISLPSGITNIGYSVFSNCPLLPVEGYVIYADWLAIGVTDRGQTTYSIKSGTKWIGPGAFEYCSNMTSMTIPEGVTKIDSNAFGYCTSLISVTIPTSVTSLDSSAFHAGEGYEYTGLLKTIIVGEKEYEYDGASEEFTIELANGSKVTLYMWTHYSCFLPDTQITLADGTTKAISGITYADELKVWNFDEGHYDTASICWLTKVGLKNNHYYQLTFSDGTILKTTGKNSNHKVYCTDTNKFEGVAYIEVGAHVFTENGVVTITDKQYIEEEVEYYNLITKQHFNCFANGVLTSDRYGNIYPIGDDMIFIKNGRPVRPYSEFEAVNIKRYWYDTLRLGENTETVDETKRYIMKLEAQMRPID